MSSEKQENSTVSSQFFKAVFSIGAVLSVVILSQMFPRASQESALTREQENSSNSTLEMFELKPPSSVIPTAPTQVFHYVPFTPQAPLGDWSDPFDEACEEASVAMSIAWVWNTPLSAEDAKDAILAQVAFEKNTFGHYRDTTVHETERIFREFYRYPYVSSLYGNAVTVDRIREELARGNLVLLPLAGALLDNKYFKAPPPYHMVVARGYDDAEEIFIVNEPGTKFGENFQYPYSVLEAAIRDWTGSEETILSGERAMLIVPKKSFSEEPIWFALPQEL